MLHDSFKARSSGVFFGDTDGTVTGFGQANEIAVGGAIVPGVIVAGAFVADIARTTKTDATGYPVSPSNSYVLATLGPLLDVYPDPAGGFHLQAGGGFGLTSGVQPQGASGGSGVGFGLFAGTGYEWWISPQWGLGALLRLQYVSAHESESVLFFESYDVDHRGIGASLLLSATYN
jgi:hypothetical protein